MPLPVTGVLAGMDQATLQALLRKLQDAYVSLSLGGQPETVSYSQGDGSRSVKFRPAQLPQLRDLITQVQRALGMPTGNQGPMAPLYL